MTVSVARNAAGSTGDRNQSRIQAAPPAPARSARSRSLGIRAGQVVAAQAAVALVGAALGNPLLLAAAVPVAALLLLVAWVRLRRRWLYEWIGIGFRYGSRRHTLGQQASAEALLDLVNPGAVIEPGELAGDAAAVLSDAYGLTAVLELGDSTGLLAEAPQTLPSPAALLPAPSPDTPPTRIQLLLSAAPAPTLSAGGGTPATSYRQLTDGRLLGHERALLAVRVLRAEGWSEADLRRSLSSAVRKVRRRLNPVPARALGEQAATAVLAELAHHDGRPVRESWQGIQAGGLHQTSFRIRRWPDLRSDTSRGLISRLLALPAEATTVALTAGPWPGGAAKGVGVDLTVRLAATGTAGLNAAVKALRRLLSAEGTVAQRLDGEQLDGVATTLPLGVLDTGSVVNRPVITMPVATMDRLHLPIGSAGLMLGANRHGVPVMARLFRAESTRVVLIGGGRAAQLIALRAMALGARLVVQTARPQAWEPFVRGVSTPGEPIAVIPPGRPVSGPPGTPLHPLLVIVDVGPVGADPRPGPAWQTTLVIRDELTAADTDALSRADLAILQPLRPAEATLAAAALGLHESAEWLTRIRQDMVGVVNRRVLRWALLSATPVELQLIGSPARF